ncbi:unnamed protein product, partial [Ectocarpus fasciculatus]
RFRAWVRLCVCCVLHIAHENKSRLVCGRANQPQEGSCRRRWESSYRRGIEQAEQDRRAFCARGDQHTNMPSSHAPIKKYNYERSLFRWLMSRHPEPFEKHGITTKTLERAPLAREAFYRSGWPGAKALVQNNEDNKFERTDFFDQIIERGLGDGDTRFNVEHVKSDERSKLGITLDSATGKYYLHAYGSAKTRRTPSRRSSATSASSSDADHDSAEPPHPTVKEVGDLIASEIEAAGEDAEVRLDKSRLERASPSGPTVLNFSISIRPRAAIGRAAAAAGGDDSCSAASGQRAGDAGAAANVGGGDRTGRGMPPQAMAAARPAQTV